jgi:glutamyl-tRNA reductase
MGRALVESLVGLPADRRPAEVIVVNRTPARAVEVASAAAGPVPVTTRPLAALAEALAEADVAFLATEADRALLSAEELAGPDRAARPLLAVDLGVPRNIARRGPVPDGVTVFDMDDLAASVAQAMEERRSEIDAARAIVDQEVARYRTAARARGAAPVVAALRGRLEGLRTAELARHRSDFAGLTDEDWAKVDALTRSVLAKLVHDPTVLLKETAGTPRGERLVEALRLLFDL